MDIIDRIDQFLIDDVESSDNQKEKFKAKLSKYKVDDVGDLPDEERRKFFDELKNEGCVYEINWSEYSDDIIYEQEGGAVTVKKWSAPITAKAKYKPPEGLFTKGASAIATRLAADSKDLKQSMSRLNFYINRAGSNLSAERKKTLNRTKELLRKKMGDE